MLRNKKITMTIAAKGGFFEDQYCMYGHSNELYSIWKKTFKFDNNGNKTSQTPKLIRFNVSLENINKKFLKNIEKYNYWNTY